MHPYTSDQATAWAKPVVIKTYGVYEVIGHTTSNELAKITFMQACPAMAHIPTRVIEQVVRVDGKQRDARVVERVL